jgi:Protein of unknown function (DUF2585)
MTSRSRPDGVADAETDSGFQPPSWLVLSLVVGITVIWLRFQGRRWWCRLGDVSPWSGGIHSPHTSQHVADPYSFTHFLHGLLFYALFRYVAGRLRWDARFVLAIALECLWEVVENSGTVIDRYRRATIALGYEGDSVINSLGDVASCGLGFQVAGRLPVKWSMALLFVIELALLIAYRDNLTLNVIMLVYPFEAVKSWQMGR